MKTIYERLCKDNNIGVLITNNNIRRQYTNGYVRTIIAILITNSNIQRQYTNGYVMTIIRILITNSNIRRQYRTVM